MSSKTHLCSGHTCVPTKKKSLANSLETQVGPEHRCVFEPICVPEKKMSSEWASDKTIKDEFLIPYLIENMYWPPDGYVNMRLREHQVALLKEQGYLLFAHSFGGENFYIIAETEAYLAKGAQDYQKHVYPLFNNK